MAEIQATTKLVAYCGLYCGACKAQLSGKCKGCHENSKATWCTVRACCIDKGIASCAECAEHDDPKDCRRFNNFMSRLFGLVFRSDRAACIAQIRRVGIDGHAAIMAEKKLHTIKKPSMAKKSA